MDKYFEITISETGNIKSNIDICAKDFFEKSFNGLVDKDEKIWYDKKTKGFYYKALSMSAQSITNSKYYTITVKAKTVQEAINYALIKSNFNFKERS